MKRASNTTRDVDFVLQHSNTMRDVDLGLQQRVLVHESWDRQGENVKEEVHDFLVRFNINHLVTCLVYKLGSMDTSFRVLYLCHIDVVLAVLCYYFLNIAHVTMSYLYLCPCFLGSVWIPFIVENWKYCRKIIFKCVNSAVRPSFKVDFARFCTCGFSEHCTGPTV